MIATAFYSPFIILHSSFALLRGQNHLDVGAAVLLPAGFCGVLGNRVRLSAPDGLEARRRDIGEVFDDVVLDRQSAPFRQRHIGGGRAGVVRVAFDAWGRVVV